MPLPYVISANLSREDAKDLILRLANDEEFRAEFESNTQQVLHEHGIEVTPQSLPEVVTLPAPDAIREFLALVEDQIVPESASPFAVLVLVLAFAAMPVMMGDRPSRDGAG